MKFEHDGVAIEMNASGVFCAEFEHNGRTHRVRKQSLASAKTAIDDARKDAFVAFDAYVEEPYGRGLVKVRIVSVSKATGKYRKGKMDFVDEKGRSHFTVYPQTSEVEKASKALAEGDAERRRVIEHASAAQDALRERLRALMIDPSKYKAS